MTRPLSPAAQAVKDAPTRAVALQALADQVVPEENWPDQSIGFADWNLATERCEQRKNIRSEILAIVAELSGEAAHG